jgi:hypothetical protein
MKTGPPCQRPVNDSQKDIPMYTSKKSVVIFAAALLAVLALTPPCPGGPILDWICGRAPNMTSQTSYVPPYVEGAPVVASPVVTMPASPVVGCGGCAPACGSCAPTCGSCAPACGGCAPQVCQYAPYAAYRTVYQPVQTVAYQPALGCYPPGGYAVTAYRPVVVWAQQPRLIPYATYRAVYPVVPVVAYSPVYAACPAPCVGYGCGVPSSGCNSCAAPQPSTYYPSAPSSALPETSGPSGATPLPTFANPPASVPSSGAAPASEPGKAGNGGVNPAQKTIYEQKPIKPEPEAPNNALKAPGDGKPLLIFPHPDAKNSSLPAPKRNVSGDRLTALPRPAIVRQVAMPILPPAQDASGWEPLQE